MAETTSTKKKKTNWAAGAVRTIAPAIPLAIALVHGAIAPKTTQPLQTPAGTTSTSTLAPPGIADCQSGVP